MKKDEHEKILRERLSTKDVLRPIEEAIIKTVEGVGVRAFCKTCGLIFLEIPIEDYNRLHDWKKPDKWFVETSIHYFEMFMAGYEHEIQLMIEGGVMQNISDIWRKKYRTEKSRGNKLSIIMQKLLELRETVKEKPI